jgi:hypothetical protein
MVAKIRPLVPSQAVMFKSVEEGGKQWLTDIRPDTNDEITMVGKFTYNHQAKTLHDLTAVLKPAGDNQWTAVYTFKWDGAAKTYKGTIKGSLKNGEVNGTGAGDGRSFSFEGTAASGVLTFKCYETTGNMHKISGDGTLKPG